MWMAACAVNSCFSYFWDVERDWEISWFTNTRGVHLPHCMKPTSPFPLGHTRRAFTGTMSGMWAGTRLSVNLCLLQEITFFLTAKKFSSGRKQRGQCFLSHNSMKA